MKLTSLLFILVMLFSGTGRLQAQPVKEYGNLSVSGTLLTDRNGNPVILRGASFGWSNWHSRFYTEETVKWLADDWKCSVVRAAMGVEPAKGYLDSPDWSKEKVEAVIRGAIASNIYVIIDFHSHGLQLKAALTFFEEMAKKYGQNPNVIYEIFNEPVNDSWNDIRNYSIEVIKKIREFDPDNIILVGSPHWDQDIHLVADNPITGFSNIMYTVHFYAGTHGKDLRDRSDYAIKKGIPVFVSECGSMDASGNGPIDYDEWAKWTEWMNSNKISVVCWSVSDKDETCSMLVKGASSTGSWKNEDLKEWGNVTREMLRSQSK
jgi:endoglucanase